MVIGEYSSRLLRRSYREGGKVRKETLANLSHLPDEAVQLVRGALQGRRYLDAEQALVIERSLPAGHVQAALVMARRLALGRLLDRAASHERDLSLAMIVQRALGPGSNLQTGRSLKQSTLACELDVAGAEEDDLYRALDWLLERQARIEDRLAARHLRDAELVLYDASSSYFEGRSCPMAKLGYSRDRKHGTLQIVYGLLCDRPGRPIAVEVFSGERHDDTTLPAQVVGIAAARGELSTSGNQGGDHANEGLQQRRQVERAECERSVDRPHAPRRGAGDPGDEGRVTPSRRGG